MFWIMGQISENWKTCIIQPIYSSDIDTQAKQKWKVNNLFSYESCCNECFQSKKHQTIRR